MQSVAVAGLWPDSVSIFREESSGEDAIDQEHNSAARSNTAAKMRSRRQTMAEDPLVQEQSPLLQRTKRVTLIDTK